MSCDKECVYCDENCILQKDHMPQFCRCLAHMSITEEQFNKSKIKITVTVGSTTVSCERPLLAELPTDNEENSARLADQLVRSAIRRHYENDSVRAGGSDPRQMAGT